MSVGVAAEQHRLGEQPVPERVEELGDADVGGVVGRRPHRGVVVGAAHALGTRAAQLDGRATVAEQQVVGDREGVEHHRAARRVLAERVAVERRHVGLVDRYPVLDAVGVPRADQGGVLGEGLDGVAVEPAAVVLEGLREVPVVERHHRRHARVEQAVDEAVVEVEALLVGHAAPAWQHPRPRDREPVVADPEVAHQPDVLGVAVVVVAGHVAGLPVLDPPGLVAERVPDAGAATVLGGGALDLVRRGAGAEAEAGRQLWIGGGHGPVILADAPPSPPRNWFFRRIRLVRPD